MRTPGEDGVAGHGATSAPRRREHGGSGVAASFGLLHRRTGARELG
ncbi:hypothetical protein RAJCM14343_3694 [Rhodococcus aetherivorans]|uniref:Uncharacterized protein n=1 Tax=Rhodococcus aetherivorans TaxID=191292 RepID=A0ABQ0YPN7_9NOCA|nr:hypothetical protein RAJCM14343_3694 [Rhodococcus aetherivorans]CCW13761.1 hypothetical protein EBESD8_43240 [Rhodococcus aetherivorans]